MYWHTQTAQEVADALDVEVQKGLPSVKVVSRMDKYGRNELAKKRGKPFAAMLFIRLRGPMMIILLLAAVLCVALKAYIDGAVIAAVVVLNALLGVMQDRRAERTMDALRLQTQPRAAVMRDGLRQEVVAGDLVPGDIIFFEMGDIIPADGRLITADSLRVEESSLTGESSPVRKSTDVLPKLDTQLGDRKNMVFSHSRVIFGSGSAVITETGMQTQVGRIADMMHGDDEKPSPLERSLSRISGYVSAAAVLALGVLLAAGITGGMPVEGIASMLAVAAVAVIPEGLFAVVSAALAVGVQRMNRKGAVIKSVHAVETLGCASVICSDKTGTLTQNRMVVSDCYTGGQRLKVRSDNRDELRNIMLFSTMCTDAEADTDKAGELTVRGDPTEAAIIEAAHHLGIDKGKIVSAYPRVGAIPFDPARRLMSVVCCRGDQYIVATKGAPDLLLDKCTQVYSAEGIVPLNEMWRSDFMAENKQMAGKALRVLAVAVRMSQTPPAALTPDELERDLVLVGLLGMNDPPRPEAREAVRLCQEAGIKTVMITGDHIETAYSVGKQLGILKNYTEAVTGDILDIMDDDELYKRIREFSVYARVTPEHKVRIVKAWQRAGEIVAVTGDGVNDAPALSTADIGCAMGTSGTDVAREAADMVLSADNFASLVGAVREGRGIYNNVRRVVQLLLSANIAELMLVMVCALSGWSIPFSALGLLWINIIVACLPALAISVGAADKSVMRARPRPRNEGLLAHGMGVVTLVSGVVLGLITLASCSIGMNGIACPTVAFFTLALGILLYSFSASSGESLLRHGVLSNKQLLVTVIIALALQLVVAFVPSVRGLFGLEALDAGQWLKIALLAVLALVMMELIKLVSAAVLGQSRQRKEKSDE